MLDYFTDISRLKHFHQAKHINSLKVISYETYWLLRRKPIQILVEDETSDAMAFLNEKFVFSRIAKYLMGDGKRVILSPETKKGFTELSRFAVLLPEITAITMQKCSR